MGPRGPGRFAALPWLRRLQGPGILDATVALWRRYGDTVVLPLPFGRSLYFLHDPADVMQVLQRQARRFVKGRALDDFRALIGDGVATADQEHWVEHRRQVQPSFHHRGLERCTPVILAAAAEHRRRWCAAGGFQDFNRLLPRLALDVVARAVLGADLGPRLATLQSAWDDAMAFVLRRSNALLRPPLAWPLSGHRRFAAARQAIRDSVAALIENAGAGAGAGLVGRLAAGGDTAPAARPALIDQVLNILFAGHETTAAGLAAALHLILTHPPVRARIAAELETCLGGRAPDHAALVRLVYLRRVVYEALRLYPPVALFVREALDDTALATLSVPRGAVIILSPYVLHRRSALWAAPERFDPDRFAEPACVAPPYFFAFGAGGRTCLGDAFAINAMVLILADMLQTLALEQDPSRPVGRAFTGTLRPAPLRIRVALSGGAGCSFEEPPDVWAAMSDAVMQ